MVQNFWCVIPRFWCVIHRILVCHSPRPEIEAEEKYLRQILDTAAVVAVVRRRKRNKHALDLF